MKLCFRRARWKLILLLAIIGVTLFLLSQLAQTGKISSHSFPSGFSQKSWDDLPSLPARNVEPAIQAIINQSLGEPNRKAWNLTTFSLRPSPEPDSSGYILSLYYHGQQRAGIRAIIAQQCWVHSFGLPMKIVEPFSNHSHLLHNRQFWSRILEQGRNGVRFGSFYDIDHFNQISARDGDPPLVSFEHFFQNAPRTVILLQISKAFRRQCLNFPSEGCVSRSNSTAFNKFTSDCSTTNMTKPALDALVQLGFKIVRTVCLNCESVLPGDVGITPGDITAHIFGPYKPSDVTLLSDTWQFSIHLAPKCNWSSVCTAMDEAQSMRLIPSNHLENSIKRYEKELRHDHGSVAFMIRMEWALISYRGSFLSRLSQCFDNALDLFNKQLKNNGDGDRRPLLAVDVGKYGSVTIPVTLRRYDPDRLQFALLMEKLEQFVGKLYRETTGWTLSTWEDSFAEVIPGEEALEAGYIAAMQSVMASQADCLVLIGGGHYQQAVVVEYAKRHTHKCVHFLCTPPNWAHAFKVLLGIQ